MQINYLKSINLLSFYANDTINDILYLTIGLFNLFRYSEKIAFALYWKSSSLKNKIYHRFTFWEYRIIVRLVKTISYILLFRVKVNKL